MMAGVMSSLGERLVAEVVPAALPELPPGDPGPSPEDQAVEQYHALTGRGDWAEELAGPVGWVALGIGIYLGYRALG